MSSDQGAAAVVEEPAIEPVVELPRRKKSGDKKKPKKQPPYNVILWNDNDHSVDYVVAMLQKLFGHPREKGLQLAGEVDSLGRTIVYTTAKEHAEFKRDQIHAFGKDDLIAGCKGSMKASIEPAE